MAYPTSTPEEKAARAASLRSRYLLKALTPADFDYWSEYDGEEFGGMLPDDYLARHIEGLMIKYAINRAIAEANDKE